MKAKQIKSGKTSKSKLHAYRVVVRGTITKGKKELRVRKVFTTPAANEKSAVSLAQPRIRKEAKGLRDQFLKVFPPLPRKAA